MLRWRAQIPRTVPRLFAAFHVGTERAYTERYRGLLRGRTAAANGLRSAICDSTHVLEIFLIDSPSLSQQIVGSGLILNVVVANLFGISLLKSSSLRVEGWWEGTCLRQRRPGCYQHSHHERSANVPFALLPNNDVSDRVSRVDQSLIVFVSYGLCTEDHGNIFQPRGHMACCGSFRSCLVYRGAN